MERDSAEDLELLDALRRVAAEDGEPPSAGELAEPVLGRYRVRRRLGGGGMGIVYEAEQLSPRRTVALKVLRPGIATRAMQARFQYEAEVLGRLDHPCIAKVLEAGTYDTGEGPQPWFAMELVEGRPLTTWVAARRPGRRERLELFRRICDAVHHAHQKGVIHRDLKPGNILVDEAGRPKVVDFGVARAADPGDGTTTLRTLAGQLVGTLPYMSPEQVEGEPDAVDVRADVYGLGVVLYELLTCRLPLDLAGKPLAEAARIVASVEPPRLGALAPELAGDLEVIVAKALAKERDRRYESAAALGEDVRRHLEHEPIAARPPSGLYQLGKFARRNPGLVASALAVVLALGLGIATTWSQAVRAREAERATSAALERARADARRSSVAAGFLRSILEQANPYQEVGGEVTMLDVLETAAGRVRAELADEPEVEALVRLSLGRAYLGLGETARALENLERALALTERTHGADHPELVPVLASLAQRAVSADEHDELASLVERALAIDAASPARPRDVAVALIALADGLYRRARYAEADARARRALALLDERGPDERLTRAEAWVVLAGVRLALADAEEAEALLRAAAEAFRAELGERNLHTASMQSNLGELLVRRGELDEAERCVRAALEVRRARLGDDHADVAHSLRSLGLVHHARGERAEAAELYRESVDILRRALGDGHVVTLQGELFLAQVLVELGDEAGAEPWIEAILAASADPPAGPLAGAALRLLGAVRQRAGRHAEADAALDRAADAYLAVHAPDHPSVVDVRLAQGAYLTERGRYAEAEAVLVPLLELVEADAEAQHPAAGLVRYELAELYDLWERSESAAASRP